MKRALFQAMGPALETMSQKQIADKCGLSEAEISLILTRKRMPRLRTLVKLANGLGFSLPRLIEELI